MPRLAAAERLFDGGGDSLGGVVYWSDWPYVAVPNIWEFHSEQQPAYVVQTNWRIVQRCMLMTTRPGELVLDPTCGSGTTPFVAEMWGRRWIGLDTSRVAIAIARQRLLTSKYDYFNLSDAEKGLKGGFRHDPVRRVTLKSIAKNRNLDPVLTRHESILGAHLAEANLALSNVSDVLRRELKGRLLSKQKQYGAKYITDSDQRRWNLPAKGNVWQHWEVPFDSDPDYPADLKKAIEGYREAWRAKMDEVSECIKANADPQELINNLEKDRKITRVSGPFTVEAVQPPEMSLGDATIVETGFAGEPDELSGTFAIREVQMGESTQNLEAYLSKMVDLLRMDGVRFPDNKQKKFTRLDPIYATGSSAGIHAEGRWANVGETDEDPEGDATVYLQEIRFPGKVGIRGNPKLGKEDLNAATPGQEHVPPVLILVCDNTDIAEVFYRKISGETETETVTEADVAEMFGEDDAETGNGDGTPEASKQKPAKAGKRKTTTVYGKGAIFPEHFSNTPDVNRTIRIDTKLLAEAESDDPKKKRLDAAEELRQVVATVGKPGQPGEHVRCVVSVSMLTEGWDANNVTHILGVRAFGSQLLCEQVVGRGLRRMDYVPDPKTGLLTEEYVDVYGIPFSVIPFKGRPVKGPAPDDRPKNHVRALPDRKAMEMRFPVVEGYAFALRKNLIRCGVDEMPVLDIEPNREPTATFVRPTVGYTEGSPSAHTSPFPFAEQDREEYYRETHLQTIEFEIARLIVDQLTAAGSDAKDRRRRVLALQSRHQLFPQVFRYVDEYVRRKVNFQNCDPCELGLAKYVQRIVERLRDSIVPDESEGEAPLMPITNRYKPIGTTAEVDFKTTRACHATMKSHIDQVVLDNLVWESSAGFRLESSDAVQFYARNDHMGMTIPYEYMGIDHDYEPDFLVRLSNGVTVVLEIKGFEDDQTKAKHTAAIRWVEAVNNWGQLRRWAFHVCRNPQLLDKEMEYLARAESVRSEPERAPRGGR